VGELILPLDKIIIFYNIINMYNIEFIPEQIEVLSTEEQIKAYVHPVRMSILDLLAEEKLTISDVAKKFGVHPATITHHFKLLQRVGLIKLVEKRDAGRNIEKYYRAAALNFEVKLRKDKPVNKKALGLSILRNSLSTAIKEVRYEDEKPVVSLMESARIKAKDFPKFQKKLMSFIKEFRSFDSSSGEGYILSVGFYPDYTTGDSKKEIYIK
jgi:DNA-binding transcriptional ArsR family regulator